MRKTKTHRTLTRYTYLHRVVVVKRDKNAHCVKNLNTLPPDFVGSSEKRIIYIGLK